MKKLVCVLFAGMLLLSGCAEPEEKTVFCRVETNGLTEEMTLNALDDQVLSTKSVMKLPFALYGIVTEEEKEMFTEQMLESFHYDGITVEAKSTADEFVLEMTIVYEEVKLEDLISLGMMSEEDRGSEMISLEKTLESLTSSGYTCE